MKLVIDIDDELYKAICECDDSQIISHVAIKNGTPYEELKTETKKCPICGSDLYEYCFMCCYEGKKVSMNET